MYARAIGVSAHCWGLVYYRLYCKYEDIKYTQQALKRMRHLLHSHDNFHNCMRIPPPQNRS
jgi:hypothetical protein